MENLFQGTESAKTEATIRVFAGSALKRHSQLNRPDARPVPGYFATLGFILNIRACLSGMGQSPTSFVCL
jgi:hypothetical protein